MSFPTNPVDGQEYTNPDNGKIYRWDDPPGAWTFIGTDDGGGGSGGETPNPPGEGIVVGTQPRVQLYTYDNNQLVCYAKNDFAVKVDRTLAPNQSESDLIFSYSYDLTTWYPCNETGGAKNNIFHNIAHGYKSNGDEVYFTKEYNQYSRIWKSSNGIDWGVQSASMPSGASTYNTPAYSRDTMVLLLPTNTTSNTIYRSTDDGATWTAKSLGFTPDRRSWYIDSDIIVAFASANDCRVSIDGGNTFQQCSGISSGFDGTRSASIFMTRTNPKTLVLVGESSSNNECYYLRLSDIESGNRSFTRGSTDAFSNGAGSGNVIATEIDGKTFVVMFVLSGSNSRVRAVELNADNTDIENQRQYYIQNVNISAVAATPNFPNLPQEGSLRVFSPNNVSMATNDQSVVAGFGADLFFNGAKLALSGRNRLAF